MGPKTLTRTFPACSVGPGLHFAKKLNRCPRLCSLTCKRVYNLCLLNLGTSLQIQIKIIYTVAFQSGKLCGILVSGVIMTNGGYGGLFLASACILLIPWFLFSVFSLNFRSRQKAAIN